MFADRLHAAITRTATPLIAGLDPDLTQFPEFIRAEASKASTNEAAIYTALTTLYGAALAVFQGTIPAIKPNSAFFEQYGVGGFRALLDLCAKARSLGILVVLDAKRGDIGSTAQAYSRAALGRATAFGMEVSTFAADALTVNPYLGFDTLEPFLSDCQQHGAGLFVLVRTSNPGSAALQTATNPGAASSADKVATWIAERGATLTGTCGLSGLGAVVGATYPAEAQALRRLMPNNYFLIPGFGAQGGTAADAHAGFRHLPGSPRDGAIVNASRGIFSSTVLGAKTLLEFQECLRNTVVALKTQLQ